MDGLKVGHYTDHETGTGASVFLFDKGAVGSYALLGAASATHEIAVLEPEHTVMQVHGLMLSGGSTFGLYAAEGLVRFLAEKNIGFQLPHATIPLVPAASLYDLNYRKPISPTADAVYQACKKAAENNTNSGNIGAGTGATVGKLMAGTYPMKSGIGRAAIELSSGLQVIAYVAVNAVGDVHDHGIIQAGACYADKTFANTEKLLLSGCEENKLFQRANTTLSAVFTNAKGDKASLKRVAKMAGTGMARSITPVFTPYDGDIMFCFSLGDLVVSELMLGSIAAEAVRLAILDAVRQTEIVL